MRTLLLLVSEILDASHHISKFVQEIPPQKLRTKQEVSRKRQSYFLKTVSSAALVRNFLDAFIIIVFWCSDGHFSYTYSLCWVFCPKGLFQFLTEASSFVKNRFVVFFHYELLNFLISLRTVSL